MRKPSFILCSIVASSALAGAQVPLTWNSAEQEQLLPPQWLSQDDYYGRDVAISGDRAVVGAYLDDPYATDSGAAYVFVRDSQTRRWTWEARLLPPAATAGTSDRFGFSVDIDGDTIVVGAYLDNQPTGDGGAAYVYERIGGTWTLQATLTASNSAAGDGLGVDVAIDGDLIVCGAWGADRSGVDSGAAYVFLRSGGAWCQQYEIVPIDGAANDYFGRAVDVSGDTIAVGAYGDNEFVSDEGSAYVFVRVEDAVPGLSCGDTWAPQGAKLLNPNKAPTDYFGFSVALEADTLVIGAHEDDHDNGGSPVNCGSFTVFERQLPGPIWVVVTKVFASHNGAPDYHTSDFFGVDVAIDGDTILAGAHYDHTIAANYAGSAYVYKRSQSGAWNQRLKLLACDGAYDDEFGVSVDVSGDTVVAGAFLDDAVSSNSGSAYAFVFARDTYDTFCHGDGSGPACPCSNNSVVGAGQGCKNSLQNRGAALRPGGSTSVAANDLELYACNIPGGNACVLFGGTGSNPGLPFYAGLKCVPPPTVRLGLLASSNTGHVVWTPNNVAIPNWTPGQTWYFQVWYRDPTFVCVPPATTNLTNGVAVTLQ